MILLIFKNNDSHYLKKRTYYLLAIAATILLGLASRKYSPFLNSTLSENAGDILWAMMVYFGFRFLLVHKSLLTAISLSILFSFGIEFSQLSQADWINGIRRTSFGALVLGHGFLAIDLLRYAIGIILASCIDQAAKKANLHRHTPLR
ncbi:DUF2809 domain-containing protein [Planococcus shixiaomingii]|uniref:ribosomal maturation YjgA family protein n=1 Tax=Planococcus shixiaomingii TaxID=3058393 RepID=UPI003F540C48